MALAEGVEVVSSGTRVGFSFGSGDEEEFTQFDIFANIELPYWKWQLFSDWYVTPQVPVSLGALYGADQVGFIGGLGPGVALKPDHGRVVIDINVGGLLLSEKRYGEHYFGGYLQWYANIGGTVTVYRSINLGYRLHHYSDATMHGNSNRGLEIHFIEVSYRF